MTKIGGPVLGKYSGSGQDPHERAKQTALNKAVDAKYDKIRASKGLTPKGKRKWHYYNTKIK